MPTLVGFGASFDDSNSIVNVVPPHTFGHIFYEAHLEVQPHEVMDRRWVPRGLNKINQTEEFSPPIRHKLGDRHIIVYEKCDSVWVHGKSIAQSYLAFVNTCLQIRAVVGGFLKCQNPSSFFKKCECTINPLAHEYKSIGTDNVEQAELQEVVAQEELAKIDLNSNVGSAWVGALHIKGGIKQAPYALQQMREVGFVLNGYSYNELIHLLLQSGFCGEALQVYRRMLSEEIRPSRKTYSALMVASGKRRDIETVLNLLKEMESLGLRPNFSDRGDLETVREFWS
ncbi:hypothetical protein RJ639_030638 [Escallonia herrerae]|uniref:Pentatricopeptide repeat-containing protein n=1 Tax=Escallonia herrerae TaxID=1293975 RepID=A0AA89BBY0_9ASTE|nr:hypothetical protein RJ639_030638 [Escallonia herrerae]